MIVADKFTNTTNAPSSPRARVELYNGSALLNTYSDADYLQGFSVERIGEDSKFFGFGVCHKITVILGDYEGNVDLTGANILKVAYGVESDFIYTYPYFRIAEIQKDEASKEIAITAYDALHSASNFTVAELVLHEPPLAIECYATACANLLGLTFKLEGVQDNSFELVCDPAANFEGTESLREVLNDIAEATQTIYYINSNLELVFKRLDANGAAVAAITNDNSMNIIIGDTIRLTGITHATELGDNVNVSTGEAGATQYVRDNAFWELRDDIDTILNNAWASIASANQSAQLGVAKLGVAKLGVGANGEFTNTAFSADWFGNYLLEVGDKIRVETEDGNVVFSYVLNDVISFSGVVLEQTQWICSKGEDEGANSNRLGDALRQTFAKVDKANKQIDLVVKESAENKENIAQLQVTSNEVNISVKKIEANGVDKVTTAAGYKFDAEGLEVSKEGSEMTTRITDDGMKVYRDNTEVLTANNKGVQAIDLHARTYLIVGGNSRFEDYESTRTACFWIGG